MVANQLMSAAASKIYCSLWYQYHLQMTADPLQATSYDLDYQFKPVALLPFSLFLWISKNRNINYVYKSCLKLVT